MFKSEFLVLFRIVVRIILMRILKSDLERELLLVLKENQLLKQRRKRKRVVVTEVDRHFYLGVLNYSRRLLRLLVVIRPETVLSWHRCLVQRKWNYGNRKRGRPCVRR